MSSPRWTPSTRRGNKCRRMKAEGSIKQLSAFQVFHAGTACPELVEGSPRVKLACPAPDSRFSKSNSMPTLAEIAAALNVTFRGDGARPITGMATLDEAGPGEIS